MPSATEVVHPAPGVHQLHDTPSALLRLLRSHATLSALQGNLQECQRPPQLQLSVCGSGAEGWGLQRWGRGGRRRRSALWEQQGTPSAVGGKATSKPLRSRAAAVLP